jgi:hypothetical protein
LPRRDNFDEDDDEPVPELSAKEREALQKRIIAASAQLLAINSEIRKLEHYVSRARMRRKMSIVSYILGPALLLALYAIFWLPWITGPPLVAISIPGFAIATWFCGAAVKLARDPGGGPKVPIEGETKRRGKQLVRRRTEGELELEIARNKDTKKLKIADGSFDQKTRRLIYKEEAFYEIEKLRTSSKKYRNVNNLLQAILIIGSIAASGAAGLAASFGSLRWVILGISLVVGISSGFMGYYKYKERSFYLQQTADAIEHEWEAFEVGVGRYKYIKKEDVALKEFVEEVHRLKSEQRKREQNLEQPPETRHSGDS